MLCAFEQRKTDEGKSISHITSVVNLSKEFLCFLEGLGIWDIEKVSQAHIDQYFIYLQHRKNKRRCGGLSNSYLDKHREAVLRLLEFYYQVDLGQTAFYIPMFQKGRLPKEVLIESEVITLFKEQNNTINGIRNKAILSILYGCGMRKGELHRLNVQDIDMAKDVIRIEMSKTSQQRDVPMTPTIKSHIEVYLYSVRELLLPTGKLEDAFLLNNCGKRLSLNGIQKKIEAIAKYSSVDKPITAHRLRHAIATHLLGDFSIEEVALFLGHKSIDSTQIYTEMKYTKTPTYL